MTPVTIKTTDNLTLKMINLCIYTVNGVYTKNNISKWTNCALKEDRNRRPNKYNQDPVSQTENHWTMSRKWLPLPFTSSNFENWSLRSGAYSPKSWTDAFICNKAKVQLNRKSTKYKLSSFCSWFYRSTLPSVFLLFQSSSISSSLVCFLIIILFFLHFNLLPSLRPALPSSQPVSHRLFRRGSPRRLPTHSSLWRCLGREKF